MGEWGSPCEDGSPDPMRLRKRRLLRCLRVSWSLSGRRIELEKAGLVAAIALL